MKNDTIRISLDVISSHNHKDQPTNLARCYITINDIDVKVYVSIKDLINTISTEQCYVNPYDTDDVSQTSNFYPFSCSCGVPGCASIWQGIDLKVTDTEVIWNIPKDCGYEFLNVCVYRRYQQDFYNKPDNVQWIFTFDKTSYFMEIESLKRQLAALNDDIFYDEWDSTPINQMVNIESYVYLHADESFQQ